MLALCCLPLYNFLTFIEKLFSSIQDIFHVPFSGYEAGELETETSFFLVSSIP